MGFFNSIIEIDKIKELIGYNLQIQIAINQIFKDIIADFNKYKADNFKFDLSEGASIYNDVQQEWEFRKLIINKITTFCQKKKMFQDSGNTDGLIEYVKDLNQGEKNIYKLYLTHDKETGKLENEDKMKYASVNVIKRLGYSDESVKDLYSEEDVDKACKLVNRKNNKKKKRYPYIKDVEETKENESSCLNFFFWSSSNSRNSQESDHSDEENYGGRDSDDEDDNSNKRNNNRRVSTNVALFSTGLVYICYLLSLRGSKHKHVAI